MKRHAWKALAFAGLIGTAAGVAGCNERQQQEVREDARDVGKEVGEAARKVEGTAREATEGFREGLGGSGTQQGEDADIGRKEGVINDGEGPFEQRDRKPGESPTLLDDGQGPLEEGERR